MLWGMGAQLTDVPSGSREVGSALGPPFKVGISTHLQREERDGWSKTAEAPTRHGFRNPSFQPDLNVLAGDPAMANPAAHGEAPVTRYRSPSSNWNPGSQAPTPSFSPHLACPKQLSVSASLSADASRCEWGSGLRVREGEGQWHGRPGGWASRAGPLPEGPGEFHDCPMCLNIDIHI